MGLRSLRRACALQPENTIGAKAAEQQSLLSTKRPRRTSGTPGRVPCKLLDVGNVIPGVSIEGLLEPQLVQVVADETDGTAQHKEAVQAAEVDEVRRLILGEGAAGSQHVHEGDSDAAVDVEDEV